MNNFETKPLISSYTSRFSSVPDLISHLKSAFREKDFSLVQKILMDREENMQKEIENLKKYFESVKKERDFLEKSQALIELEKLQTEEQLKEAEEKARVYEQKFSELEVRMLRLEEEIAKNGGVDVSVVHKMADDLEAEREEVVEVNSGAGSTGNGSGNLGGGGGGGGGGEEGSGNMDFVSAKMNLGNRPDVPTLHSTPSACGSAQVDSNETKRCSKEADALPVNLACENGALMVDLPAREAGACTKNILNTISGRAGSSTVVHISDSDDENAMPRVSNSYGVGRNLTFPHKIKEEDIKDPFTSLSKRKRSLSESDTDDGSLFGKQKTRSIQELDCDGKQSFVLDKSPRTVFIRRCDDKDGGKCYSQLFPRRSDLCKISDESSSDSENDPCSDKAMDMLMKRIRESKKWLLEDGLSASFEKDPELCMNAVCALYRLQISPDISSKGLAFTESQWLSQFDKISVNALGEYLIDGDPENKLRKAVAEVRPKDHAECKRLATKYCQQLHQIFLSKADHLFRPGAI